jgi:tellurite resistance protein TerC
MWLPPHPVRRIFRVVAGFTLLAIGAALLILPGPGWLTILLGLALLATEYVWARRWLDRLQRTAKHVKSKVTGR